MSKTKAWRGLDTCWRPICCLILILGFELGSAGSQDDDALPLPCARSCLDTHYLGNPSDRKAVLKNQTWDVLHWLSDGILERKQLIWARKNPVVRKGRDAHGCGAPSGWAGSTWCRKQPAEGDHCHHHLTSDNYSIIWLAGLHLQTLKFFSSLKDGGIVAHMKWFSRDGNSLDACTVG